MMKNFTDANSHDGRHDPSSWALAVHPDTPAGILEQLAVSKSRALVERVAEHGRATDAILMQLSVHECPMVRTAVAQNRNTAEHVVMQLAQDDSCDVRYAIAENPHSPLRALETLAADDNPYVSHRALKTLQRIRGAAPVTELRPNLAVRHEMA